MSISRETATFLQALLVSFLGWGIVHWLTFRRDVANKRREQRLMFMIEAFRDLNKLRSFADVLNFQEISELLVRIANNIELFGSTLQLELFEKVSAGIANQGELTNDVHTLVDSLRDDIRQMLQYSKSPKSVSHFQIPKATPKRVGGSD